MNLACSQAVSQLGKCIPGLFQRYKAGAKLIKIQTEALPATGIVRVVKDYQLYCEVKSAKVEQ
jgi:hypothetical protein